MWEISKKFEFDYGHRVWTQDLNPEMALTNKNKCRHLHGHRGKIEVHLSGSNLTGGMVTDFNHLNFFKKWVDEYLDHKFLIDINDPLFNSIVPECGTAPNPDHYSHKCVPINKDPLTMELAESFTIVNFVPTSEEIARWIFNVLFTELNPKNITVSKVTFWETPKSKTVFSL